MLNFLLELFVFHVNKRNSQWDISNGVSEFKKLTNDFLCFELSTPSLPVWWKYSADSIFTHVWNFDPSVDSIMKAINPNYEVNDIPPLSMKRWVVSGILMIIAMLFFGITGTDSDSQLSVSFYLVFAGIVTAYCAMFVGCNMDFFVKHINKFAQ